MILAAKKLSAWHMVIATGKSNALISLAVTGDDLLQI
jgi:hypothetical protein